MMGGWIRTNLLYHRARCSVDDGSDRLMVIQTQEGVYTDVNSKRQTMGYAMASKTLSIAAERLMVMASNIYFKDS